MPSASVDTKERTHLAHPLPHTVGERIQRLRRHQPNDEGKEKDPRVIRALGRAFDLREQK